MAHEFFPARLTNAKRPIRGLTLLGPLLLGAGCSTPAQEPKAPAPVPAPVKAVPVIAPAKPLLKPAGKFRLGDKLEIRTIPGPVDLPKVLSKKELNQRFIPQTPKPGLWAMLDQHPARAFVSRQLKFSDLINEDEEIAPGFHWLSLFQELSNETESVLTISLSAVAVESEPEGMPLAPGCALLWPVGTYNGRDAAANIRVLAVPRQAGVTTVQYEARSGEWLSQGSFPVGQVLLLDSPPDGDVEVSATCMVEEESLSMTTQIITINSETAPSEGEP